MNYRNIDEDWEDSWDQIPYLNADSTNKDKYGPAMEIHDQEAADAYFEKCVTHTMTKGGVSRQKAEEIERSNLGYFAGYYSDLHRERVERLFRCEHPIFGSIAKYGPPSPEMAFQMGLALGEKAKNESKQ
jgi:hypothetical protein